MRDIKQKPKKMVDNCLLATLKKSAFAAKICSLLKYRLADQASKKRKGNLRWRDARRSQLKATHEQHPSNPEL